MSISLQRAEELLLRAIGILATNPGEVRARLHHAREDVFELHEIVAKTDPDGARYQAELNARIASIRSTLAGGGVMDLSEDQGVDCAKELLDLYLSVRAFRKDVP